MAERPELDRPVVRSSPPAMVNSVPTRLETECRHRGASKGAGSAGFQGTLQQMSERLCRMMSIDGKRDAHKADGMVMCER